MAMRKTKIVATLGPASSDVETIKQLICAGMDVARFNFSHGDHREQLGRLQALKQAREELNKPVAALLDTKGPEVRLGRFRGGKAELVEGQSFTLTTDSVVGDEKRASVSYKRLPLDVRRGDVILLDDGNIELCVKRVTGSEIETEVVDGGTITDRKGVNLPGVHLNMPYMSEADEQDILFGIKHGFDIIAASFVRNADDLLQLREFLDQNGGGHIKVIAKIENAEGVENAGEIIRSCDGIMVARGDMGVEIPLEEVPVQQKKLIKRGYLAGKQVITATQMLESMITHPRPTRAEGTDVANAIYDGTSAIMLSGETAAGKYPVKAVETMARIALRTEQDIDYKKRFFTESQRNHGAENTPDAISHASCTISYDLNAAALLAITKTGTTAKLISKFRPSVPIIGGAMTDEVMRQLNLSWNVFPIRLDEKMNMDELFAHAVEQAVEAGYLHRGELVIITAGIPLGVAGRTNMIKVHVVE